MSGTLRPTTSQIKVSQFSQVSGDSILARRDILRVVAIKRIRVEVEALRAGHFVLNEVMVSSILTYDIPTAVVSISKVACRGTFERLCLSNLDQILGKAPHHSRVHQLLLPRQSSAHTSK